jgi:integrase
MSIRRHGRSWQVRLPGEPAKSFPTRAAAGKHELQRKLARSLGDLHTEQPITVSEMLDGYLHRWQTRSQPARSSVERAQDAVVFWKRAFGDRLLTRLSLVEAEDAVIDRASEHPNAAKKELEWLKRALKDAHRRGQRFDSALLMIDPIRAGNRQGVALDLDELERLASWFPEQIALMPEIVGLVGLRLGEALGLTDDRVDLKAGAIFIPAAMCKERRDKLIELAPVERTLLAEQLVARTPGTPFVFPRAGGKPGPRGGKHHQPGRWDPGDFYTRVWHPARDAAAREWRDDHSLSEWAETRFDAIVPHDLRHTAISLMAASGMRPETIAARVGHKDGGKLILTRYRHLFPDELAVHLGRYDTFLRDRREQRRLADTPGGS